MTVTNPCAQAGTLANPEHLAKLKEGVEEWNEWRKEHPEIQPDLSEANLSGENLYGAHLGKADLTGANLSGAILSGTSFTSACLRGADLSKAHLSGAFFANADLRMANLNGADLSGVNLRADLSGADLSEAELIKANLNWANLYNANLKKANLSGAHFIMANLIGADLGEACLSASDLSGACVSGANLSGADLRFATLVNTNLEGANLTACSVFGVSAWNVKLEGAIQSNLVITPEHESPIQVDNLEVAQFIYLLLNNEKIRSAIDTITSKVVLILGRFTEDRKVVLNAIRDELRKRGYLPVLFDFKKPDSKNLTGTISTLANLARFVIVDLTDPSSVPHELATVVPVTRVPVQPIVLEGQREYGMFGDLKDYPWVLEPHQYKSKELLIANLSEWVIDPAEAKAKELAQKK